MPSPELRVGCSGFPMARARYFAAFRLVEVQHTFYEPPGPATLARWRAEAPSDFEFTLKAWQLVTHEPSSPTYRRLRTPIAPGRRSRYGSFRPTPEVAGAWRRTLECARALRARAIVFQCPVSFAPTEEHVANLRRFFRGARAEAGEIALGWEPRGAWPRALVRELCAELGVRPVLDPLAAMPYPGPWRYFRLHGRGGYRDRYSDAELRGILSLCRGTTYVLFNNAAMVEDAQRFLALAEAR
ncbi:MAG: DUF72 domain-containing protein [Burkholderiales bacterium]|nr:DUF72 domain-containing protein [Burkholderiales bacterium]